MRGEDSSWYGRTAWSAGAAARRVAVLQGSPGPGATQRMQDTYCSHRWLVLQSYLLCCHQLSFTLGEPYSVAVNLQAYCQTVTITNPSRAAVEATLRAGSSDRYTLSPTNLALKPHESLDVDVRLRVLKYAQRQKGVQLGQRDIFHIKASHSLPYTAMLNDGSCSRYPACILMRIEVAVAACSHVLACL